MTVAADPDLTGLGSSDGLTVCTDSSPPTILRIHCVSTGIADGKLWLSFGNSTTVTSEPAGIRRSSEATHEGGTQESCEP